MFCLFIFKIEDHFCQNKTNFAKPFQIASLCLLFCQKIIGTFLSLDLCFHLKGVIYPKLFFVQNCRFMVHLAGLARPEWLPLFLSSCLLLGRGVVVGGELEVGGRGGVKQTAGS